MEGEVQILLGRCANSDDPDVWLDVVRRLWEMTKDHTLRDHTWTTREVFTPLFHLVKIRYYQLTARVYFLRVTILP